MFFFKEVRPLIHHLLDFFDALGVNRFPMLGKIDSNRLEVSQCQAVWMLGSISSYLIAEGGVKVTDLAEYIAL